ncbi:MAG: glycosyltransferase family 4 protein [Gemmatimonadales bacterium]
MNAKRIFILPNTVDETRFSVGPPPLYLRARYGIQPDERVVLTVARLDPSERHAPPGRSHQNTGKHQHGHKGCDRLIQSPSEVQRAVGPVRYLVVRKGSDRKRLEGIARNEGVLKQVTFAGFVPDAELLDHYRLADAFAMPSTGEGFGIVLEAMACGTPVLAGNCDGSVDALDQGRLGRLVDPDSIDEISAGLIALLGRDGPDCWFDRQCLHDAVSKRFGYNAFRNGVKENARRVTDDEL